MGTVCGGPPGDQIGVAPGAQWIHARLPFIDDIPSATISSAISGFQWLPNPDGNPNTVHDIPDVCSNSWSVRAGNIECEPTLWEHLDNCEAAGIVILFSAGNEGQNGLLRPADRATDDYRTFAVGAVDAYANGTPIWQNSSRGSTYCTPDESAAIKPDLVAPGVCVRSSIPGGGYGVMTGTCMAVPYVNGVVCLMRQINPELDMTTIKQILYDTATDLGAPGKDNDYGWGMVNAYAAIQEVLAISPNVRGCCLPNGQCALLTLR